QASGRSPRISEDRQSLAAAVWQADEGVFVGQPDMLGLSGKRLPDSPDLFLGCVDGGVGIERMGMAVCCTHTFGAQLYDMATTGCVASLLARGYGQWLLRSLLGNMVLGHYGCCIGR